MRVLTSHNLCIKPLKVINLAAILFYWNSTNCNQTKYKILGWREACHRKSLCSPPKHWIALQLITSRGQYFIKRFEILHTVCIIYQWNLAIIKEIIVWEIMNQPIMNQNQVSAPPGPPRRRRKSAHPPLKPLIYINTITAWLVLFLFFTKIHQIFSSKSSSLFSNVAVHASRANAFKYQI